MKTNNSDGEAWTIPVEWECSGVVKIDKKEAASLEDAIKYFDEHADELDIPMVDDSSELRRCRQPGKTDQEYYRLFNM